LKKILYQTTYTTPPKYISIMARGLYSDDIQWFKECPYRVANLVLWGGD